MLFHEDGDAVTALNLRKSFSTLNIIPGFDYLGKCFLSKLTSYRPDVDIDRHTSQLTEELIMISFAGAVTERIRCGGKWNEGAGKDYEDAADLAARECGSWEESISHEPA